MDSADEQAIQQEEQSTNETATPIIVRKASSPKTVVSGSTPTESVEPTSDGSNPVAGVNGTAREALPGKQATSSEPSTFLPWVPGEHLQTPDVTYGRQGREQNPNKTELPTIRPDADLARVQVPRLWMALCFTITLLIYLIFVPRVLDYSSPPTGDQPFYLMMTLSLVQDGDLNLFNNYQNRDEDKFYSLAPRGPNFVGMNAPYPLPPQLAPGSIRPQNEMYDNHVPGLSFLLVPAWVIGGFFSLWWPATIVFMCIIGALVALNIFLLAYEQTGRLWIALAVWAAIAFTNPIMTYSYMIFTELTTGLLLIYAFRRLALGWGSNGPGRLLLVGACIAYIPWLAWRCVPIAGCLSMYAALQCWRHFRANRTIAEGVVRPRLLAGLRPFLPGIALFLSPIVLSGILISWFNIFVFGTMVPKDQVPELGNQPIFLWPWQGREDLSHFAQSLFGLFFDRLTGLFPYAPIFVLALVGFVALFRSNRRADRRIFPAILFVSLPYLFIMMTFVYWNGLWCPPARYLTTLVPLLAAPLAFSLYACNNWIYRILYGLLGLYGLGVMGLLLLDPRHFWPADSVYYWLTGNDNLARSPVLPIRIDLLNLLPGFDPLDERRMPTDTAWVAIATLAIVVLGYILMARWRQAQNTRKLPRLAQGATWAFTFALVGASWYFANFDYIQHRTILTQVQRINASSVIQAARGITYLNGNIYVTDYEGMSVGVFHLDTGTYSQLQATVAGTPLKYGKLGDIKAGPDGNLYLLNNGTGNNALLEMTPDGTVVKRLALNGKTPVAVGLQVGPDGKIYVADVVGGRIWEYDPTGGDPVAKYAGQTGGFNNVLGVLVMPNGEIFAAESSNRRVQELKPGGNYVRSFQLNCQPNYMAAEGDWIDVSCPGQGIITLNAGTGSQQLSWTEPDSAPAPNSPTGMTYGPDGKLYVIDGSTLIVYTVQH